MRKFLLTMAVLAGAALATGAQAAPGVLPHASLPAAMLDTGATVQPVQYYPDYRYREFRRREAYERFRRHQERRRFREYNGYGPRYGYGYGPRY